MASNSVLFDKGLTIEGRLNVKNNDKSDLPLSRIAEWEKAASSSISTLNMIDFFTGSLNSDFKKILYILEDYKQDLPDELLAFVDEKAKIKANLESQAKGIEHATDILSWLFTDTVLARRDTVLKKCKQKFSEEAKNVLRLQPLGGPYLFNGKVDEVIKKEGEQATASYIVNQTQSKANTSQQNYYKNNTGNFQKSGGSYYNKNKGSGSGDCFFKGKRNNTWKKKAIPQEQQQKLQRL
jgi:hypothetical protein